jgi:hypothetical protein
MLACRVGWLGQGLPDRAEGPYGRVELEVVVSFTLD